MWRRNSELEGEEGGCEAAARGSSEPCFHSLVEGGKVERIVI